MTVSIGRTEVQVANGSAQRNLKGVVSGIRLGFKEGYIPVAGNGPVRIGSAPQATARLLAACPLTVCPLTTKGGPALQRVLVRG